MGASVAFVLEALRLGWAAAASEDDDGQDRTRRERNTPAPFKPEGLGLGLGIVRDIIKEFDGTVTVVPSPLGGAAFRVTVARAREGMR